MPGVLSYFVFLFEFVDFSIQPEESEETSKVEKDHGKREGEGTPERGK